MKISLKDIKNASKLVAGGAVAATVLAACIPWFVLLVMEGAVIGTVIYFINKHINNGNEPIDIEV